MVAVGALVPGADPVGHPLHGTAAAPELEAEDLFTILKSSEGSIIRQYEQTFAAYGIALVGSSSKIVYRPLPVDDPRRRRPDIARAAKDAGGMERVSERALRYLHLLVMPPVTCRSPRAKYSITR